MDTSITKTRTDMPVSSPSSSGMTFSDCLGSTRRRRDEIVVCGSAASSPSSKVHPRWAASQ